MTLKQNTEFMFAERLKLRMLQTDDGTALRSNLHKTNTIAAADNHQGLL